MVFMGDFNDIKSPEKKKGEKTRSKASCKSFREFISLMNMGEIMYQGQCWTWANNWEGEGDIEARLDRFFGSSHWLLENDRAVVRHIDNYSSNHCILLLDTTPDLAKRKKKKIFF